MTLEEIRNYQGQAVSEEELSEIENCELVRDIVNNGDFPMYPQLNWYIIELNNGEKINIFL